MESASLSIGWQILHLLFIRFEDSHIHDDVTCKEAIIDISKTQKINMRSSRDAKLVGLADAMPKMIWKHTKITGV